MPHPETRNFKRINSPNRAGLNPHILTVPFNPVVSAYTSNADMIQPGLTPLQPNLDDLMDIPGEFIELFDSLFIIHLYYTGIAPLYNSN